MNPDVLPLPPRLRWRRGTFVVMIEQLGLKPVAAEVEGIRADPFGIYRGGQFGPDLLGQGREFTLALIPSRLRVVSLGLQIHCKQLALARAALPVDWAAPTVEGMRGEDFPRAQEMLRRYRGER